MSKSNEFPRVTLATPAQPGKMYLRLFHGRDDPKQTMDDWGYDGPRLGPLQWFHTTYGSHLRILSEDEHHEIDLPLVEDMICFEGKYYGDWSVYIHKE